MVAHLLLNALRAFRSRTSSRRQTSALATLTHTKEQSRLSLGSYERPRMTEELKDHGSPSCGTFDAQSQRWVGDISYVWTREGWLYLALAIVLGPSPLSLGPIAIGQRLVPRSTFTACGQPEREQSDKTRLGI